MSIQNETRPVADDYESVLNAISCSIRKPRAIAKALAHHPLLGQMTAGAREDDIKRTLHKMKVNLHADCRGLRREWVLLRRGVSRLDSPIKPCCGSRGWCTCGD